MKKNKIILSITILIFIITLNILLVNFENQSEQSGITNLWDSFWYMFVSLTTVGYGDFYPVTIGGRIIGYIFIFCSLGLLGFLIGKLTSKVSEVMEKKKNGFYGTEKNEHLIIIGWNDFANQVASQIIQANKFVAVVTNNKNDIDLIKDLYGEKIFVLFADYDNFESLKKINIEKSTNVFINLDDDTRSLVYLLNFKKHYSNVNSIVSLNNSSLKGTFMAAGVTYVISKEDIASRLVASYIFEPDVANITEELMATSDNSLEYDIFEYKIVQENPFANLDCTKVFLKIKKDYNAIMIGISKFIDGEYKLIKNPDEEIKVEPGDYLVIMASGDIKGDLQTLFKVDEGRIL